MKKSQLKTLRDQVALWCDLYNYSSTKQAKTERSFADIEDALLAKVNAEVLGTVLMEIAKIFPELKIRIEGKYVEGKRCTKIYLDE